MEELIAAIVAGIASGALSGGGAAYLMLRGMRERAQRRYGQRTEVSRTDGLARYQDFKDGNG